MVKIHFKPGFVQGQQTISFPSCTAYSLEGQFFELSEKSPWRPRYRIAADAVLMIEVVEVPEGQDSLEPGELECAISGRSFPDHDTDLEPPVRHPDESVVREDSAGLTVRFESEPTAEEEV